MFIFVFLILFSVVGPFVWTIDDQYVDILVANQGPSTAHPLGTDNLGRDMLAQMMVGGRISISVGLTAMSISLTVGVLISIIAGYFPALDNPLMRLTDMFFALPILPLLLVIITLFRDFLQTTLGTELGIFLLIVSVIGATSWMRTARVVRGEVLAVKQQDEETFEALLNEVLAAPDDAIPELTPESIVEKGKAKELLAEREDLF